MESLICSAALRIRNGAKVEARAVPPSATYPAAEAIIHCSEIPQS